MVTSVCAKPKVMPYEPAEERKQFFRQSGATVLVEVRPRAGQGGLTVLSFLVMPSLVCWGPAIRVGLEPSAASTCVSEQGEST